MIFLAVRHGHYQALRKLVARVPSLVEARDHHGKTPLMVAASIKDRTEMMTYILEHGADLHAR